MTLGPSLGYFGAPDVSASSTTIEITGAYRIFWLSLGLRMAFASHSSHLLPYLESGVWFFANAGVGYSIGFSRGDGRPVPRHNIHLFLGAPFPLALLEVRAPLIIEPYYRPSWGSGGGAEGWYHEVGLMLKWWIAGKK